MVSKPVMSHVGLETKDLWSHLGQTGQRLGLESHGHELIPGHNLMADAMWADFQNVLRSAINCYVPSKNNVQSRL